MGRTKNKTGQTHFAHAAPKPKPAALVVEHALRDAGQADSLARRLVNQGPQLGLNLELNFSALHLPHGWMENDVLEEEVGDDLGHGITWHYPSDAGFPWRGLRVDWGGRLGDRRLGRWDRRGGVRRWYRAFLFGGGVPAGGAVRCAVDSLCGGVLGRAIDGDVCMGGPAALERQPPHRRGCIFCALLQRFAEGIGM